MKLSLKAKVNVFPSLHTCTITAFGAHLLWRVVPGVQVKWLGDNVRRLHVRYGNAAAECFWMKKKMK